MIVVEPVVTQEKLLSLLAEQAEAPTLDYKAYLDLKDRHHLVEFAKDVAAMMLDGGFIVVGVDNRGVPTGQLPDHQMQYFDESRLRANLKKWIPEPFTLLSAVHKVEGHNVALLYVGPHDAGLVVMRSDGRYTDGSGEHLVFRTGDVLARHGTASERWQQHDVERFRTRVRTEEREAIMREIGPLNERLSQGSQALQIASGPVAAFDWQLDSDIFRAVVLEVLRRKDRVGLRVMLRQARADAASISCSDSDLDRFQTLISRVSAVVAIGMEVHDRLATELGIAELAEIYDRQPRQNQLWTDAEQGTLSRWLIILAAVEALGGKAIREKAWNVVRRLTLQKPTETSERYSSWIRHALTMAARGNLLPKDHATGSVIELARRYAMANQDLASDLVDQDDRLLDSICQFDFLASVGMLAEDPNSAFYPSFALFYGRRTLPVVDELLLNQELRKAVAAIPDASLAEILRTIDRAAQREAFRYAGWDGYDSATVARFLAANPEERSA